MRAETVIRLEDRQPVETEALSLQEKLVVFDRHAEQAANQLLVRLTAERASLIALARERHVAGHNRWGDGKLFEYGIQRLRDEAAEELADAIVYHARLIGLHLSL